MLKIIIILCLWALMTPVAAQSSLTLEQCYQKAMQNHPYGLQKQELDKINQLNVKISSSSWLPQFSLQAQASYQSDVIDIDLPIPGMEFSGPTRDQYRMSVEAQQLIYDGGMTRRRIALQEITHEAELQKIEVELYQLPGKVNQHFFQHFLLVENLKILDLTLTEINERLVSTESAVVNGVLPPSARWTLEVEILRLEQSREDLEISQRSNLQIMEILVGEDISGMQLALPVFVETKQGSLFRPELNLLALQKERLYSASKLTATGNMPRLSGFVQAGYGKPGLNMLDDVFDFYYIAGIRLNWNLWDWKKTTRESQIQRIQADMIDTEQMAFEQNINMTLTSVTNRILQTEKAMERDQEVIALQQKIVESARSQLENGVIQSTEYLHHVNALAQAKISYHTRKIHLLQARTEYNIVTGNL